MQRLDEDHVFDHFYLDMNGIIHQCTHPNDDEIAVEDNNEMFARIFYYTDRLFRIVAPRSLMFLAVDGVAPRAKLNQQRARRFRSAKDAERAMSEAVARGDEIPHGVPFDSNCITPGTQFMYDLSKRFRKWIDEKMRTDPAWQKGCTVVYSGSEVPGEGEHKIMDFIRKWQKSDQYSPEVWHCMYGLDADLMMLGLVTHAPHFTLIREKIKFSKNGRRVPQMRGTESDADEFELLEIARLREMLFLEFQRDEMGNPFERSFERRSRRVPSKFGKKAILATFQSGKEENADGGSKHKRNVATFRLEPHRIVDDFVFMCMLVGNDFLPNLPHLDIAEGAINIMFRIYKEMLPGWSGYLTQAHRLHPDRVESFLQRIAASEPQYFEHRAFTDNIEEYKTAAYRRVYYLQKFKFDVEGEEGSEQLSRLRRIYMEGLHWVLQYYHNGVSSWNWFYPDFYAILASDMIDLRNVKVKFQKGHPFQPLTQLMAVLPPESAQFLPAPMRELMVNPNSPVAGFYPTDFETDMNGKRNTWEAVVIVPFIDEKRLLAEVNAINFADELTEEEKSRNKMGSENWFHASDYPYSNAEIIPVRPSKFFIPYPNRSRGSSSSTSRSSSPQRSDTAGSRSPSPRPRSHEYEPFRRRNVTSVQRTRISRNTSRWQGPKSDKNGTGRRSGSADRSPENSVKKFSDENDRRDRGRNCPESGTRDTQR